MGYIDDNLMQGENVIYRTKLHWAIFLWPIIWFVVFIISLGMGAEGAVIAVIFFVTAFVMGINAVIV